MGFLQRMRLRGFKTFARPAELVFEPGVTVIIGPNGSGKSNITDAVLWALGEQSPSALRARGMNDLLFSGGEGESPSAFAEVSLTFDNSAGVLPVDFKEVEITRRLERDGGSQYLLNGAACRLLDLQEVISQVGMGRHMHNVVGQGKIEELVSSTPEMRRALVEEAAGLGRYKKRRERTANKLARVQANLEQVRVVEDEVRKALRPLKTQMTAAERHAEVTEKLARARAAKLLKELGTIRAEMESARSEEAALKAAREDKTRELEDLRARRTQEEVRLAEALATREEAAARYHNARAKLDRLLGRKEELRRRRDRIEGERARARRRSEAAEAEAVEARRRAEAVGESPGSPDGRLAFVEEVSGALDGRLDELRPKLEELEARENELKDEVFALESERTRLQQEKDFVERERNEVLRREQELAVRLSETEGRVAQIEGAIGALEEQKAEKERLLQQVREDVTGGEAQLRELEELVESDRLRRRSTIEERDTARSRLEVLQGHIARREGMPEAARRIVESRGDVAALLDLVGVPAGYERVAAAALGPLVHAVVVESAADADGAVGGGAGAKEMLLESEGVLEAIWVAEEPQGGGGNTDPGLGRPPAGRDLWEVLGAPAGLERTLRLLVPPTAVVEDVEEGMAAAAQTQRWRFLTPEGHLVQAGVHAACRSEDAAETLLAARREREMLEVQAGELEQAAAQAARDVESREGQVEEARGALRDLRTREEESVREAKALAEEIEVMGRRLAEAEEEADEMRARRSDTAEQGRSLEADDEQLQETRRGVGERLEEARTRLGEARAEAERIRSQTGHLEAKSAQASMLRVRLRERKRAREDEIERARERRAGAEAERVRARQRVEMLERALPQADDLLQVVSELTESFEAQLDAMGRGVEDSRRSTEAFTDVLREVGAREADVQKDLAAEGERLTQVEVALAHLEERSSEKQKEMDELAVRHMSPRGLEEQDVADEDEQELEEEIARLERRRDRIGPVNPLAEQEYRETKERAEFLESQRRDLESSLSELERVIHDLDGHIESAFQEVFEAACDRFEEMVEVLFPGGSGRLRLEDAQAEYAAGAHDTGDGGSSGSGESGSSERGAAADEEPGIGLEIKLPRKGARPLRLLSGGEKALAAVAFLFALFLARPSPFYVLDEVEAALDDVNIGRFLSLVERYQSETQFIIVTHQRRTMEVADTLYGVAMDSGGTSRLLSRRLGPKEEAG